MRKTGLIPCILLTIATASCEDPTGGSSQGEPREYPKTKREEELLATCPAKAQGFFAWQRDVAERQGLRRPVPEDDVVLDPVADAAQDHLATLPVDQRGGVAIDSINDRVVVQVTRGGDQVLAALRKKADDSDTVHGEIVRWSGDQLAEFARRVERIPGLDRVAYGYGNANGRVEVEVPGNAGPVRRKISRAVPPCAFTVRGNAAPVRPG